MGEKKHIIVGGGTAGWNAIRTLRQTGEKGEITLVSRETPYARMALPYFLSGGVSKARLFTAAPHELAQLQVTTRLGVQAEKLDTASQTLTLSKGDPLSYDTLLIATGSSPARPPIPGADHAEVHTFWTLADAEHLKNRLVPAAHVVLVGAGFIALTMLDALLALGVAVTLIEAEERILPRMADPQSTAIITQKLNARGVKIRTGAALKAINTEGTHPAIRHNLDFADGTNLSADVVILATGVRPNLDWLTGAGLETRQGIIVDDTLATNKPGVYAAGDAAQGKNLITGEMEIHAIEPTAMEQGRVAGANMAGKITRYPGSLPMNILEVGGLSIASLGHWEGTEKGDDVAVKHWPARDGYMKLAFSGEQLIGGVLVTRSGELGHLPGMVKGLIQTKTPLGNWKTRLLQHPLDIKKAFLASGTMKALYN